jgi:ribose transport system permease protein
VAKRMGGETVERARRSGATLRVVGLARLANTGAIWLIVACVAVICVSLVPSFLSKSDVLAILSNASVLGITAMGVTFVLVAGELDVSVGGTATVAAVVAAGVMNGSNAKMPVAILIVVGLGALIGVVNGVLTALGVQSFILTLAMQISLLGAVQIYCGGIVLGNVAPAYNNFFLTGHFGLPTPVLCVCVVLLATYFLQEGTRLGHRMRVVGGNRATARLSGINVSGTIVGCFVISGVLASVAGLVYLGFIGPPSDFSGINNLQFTALAAVVIGGAGVAAGRGSVAGTLAGVILLGMIVSLLIRLGLPYGTQLVMEGGTIITIGAAYALLQQRHA